MASQKMPVVFLPHGGGPWPFVDLGMNDQPGFDALLAYLRSVATLPKVAPKALLVVSAHWEEAAPTVMTSAQPPMLYDYYGFPPESYQITWPAPGHPRLAARVRDLLMKAGSPPARTLSAATITEPSCL
jgi:aromatic ring-opening dioxygenase catalytic subunit (LigB family)